MTIPLSILDLAPIRRGETAADSLAASVALAQCAEEWGYRRVWYAEHHNSPAIASSATSVVIAHVAALTREIRVGAGGIMLPNHAPLTIAEQFGTLEALHPGRIDLGVGRAPGSDENTSRALRRGPEAAETFPEDVLELRGYLVGETRIPGVDATPGKGSRVPLYVLGSSMFGARLAAMFGLPYVFASHFAPEALQFAVAAYRREFRPSEQLERPYVIAGVNATAADTTAQAREQLLGAMRLRVGSRFFRGRAYADEEADAVLGSPAGQYIRQQFTYAAIGTPAEVTEYIDAFARHADADELIVAHQSATAEARLRSAQLLADAVDHAV